MENSPLVLCQFLSLTIIKFSVSNILSYWWILVYVTLGLTLVNPRTSVLRQELSELQWKLNLVGGLEFACFDFHWMVINARKCWVMVFVLI